MAAPLRVQEFGPQCHPYIKVHRERHEIRLIDLSPSLPHSSSTPTSSPTHSNILRVRSRVYSINTLKARGGDPYCAISYTWGPESEPRKPAEMNGTVVHVSRNLEAALRHVLRFVHCSTCPGRLFWADALCINQEDRPEKTWQVQMMRNIYETATVVRIWLGHGNRETARAIDALELIVRENGSTHAYDWAKQMHEQCQHQVLDHLNLAVLWKQSYFERIWPIQEFAVAREAVFHCGDRSIDRRLLFWGFTALTWLERYSRLQLLGKIEACDWPCGHDKCLSARVQYREALGLHMVIIGNGVYQRETLDFSPARIPTIVYGGINLKLDGGLTSDMSLQALVLQANDAHLKAVDPRDLIFPFLGLAHDAAEYDIVPDYTQEVSPTYINVARSFLQRGWSTLLCICQPQGRTPDLPSWVPDWTRQLRRPLSLSADFESGTVYSASTGTLNPVFLPKGSCPRLLLVSALLYDTVEVLSKDLDFMDCKGDIKEVAGLLTELCKGHGTAYSSNEEQDDAIAKTLIRDVWASELGAGNRRRTRPGEAKKGFEEVRKGFEEIISSNHGDCFDVMTAMTSVGRMYMTTQLESLSSLRPFATKRGFIGMGPECMQQGDVIAIIIGLSAPMILRKFGDGKYEIVGEAYVHGIMDGEAMDDQSVMVTTIRIK